MSRDLAELERLREPVSDKFTDEVITTMRVALARIEGKLDSLIGLSSTVATLRDKLTGAETRITKLEAWQGFAMWVAGGVWAVSLIVTAAVLTFILHH